MTDSRTPVQARGLDTVDRRLIHALQISPRARWAALAPVVGVDAVTLARRWERLSGEGLAWVAGHPGAAARGPTAILEVEARPDATPRIADELAADPESFTIDHTAGGRDLLVLVGAADLTALGDYVIGRTRVLDGVRATRTHLLSSPFTDAGQWRLGALSPDEAAALGRTVAAPVVARSRVEPELEEALLGLLGRDGRVTVASISRTLDVGERRVRESLEALTARGRLVLRTEIARAYSGWPVHAWYFLQVPAALTERVGAALTRLGEVRLAASTIGPHNLVLSVWMRTLADVQRLELAISKRVPEVSIADRSVVLRSLKKEGRVLDGQGHATGTVVPMPTDFVRGQLH